MASAAAVAANLAESPEREIGQDTGVPGEVNAKVGVPETHPGDVEDDDDDDEDDVQTSRRRRERPTNGDVDEPDEDGGVDDLFGDDEEELEDETEKPTRRLLDDEELDSGDDMDRADRAPDEPAPRLETEEKAVADFEIPRQPIPNPSDGEMYLLKVPGFLAIEPTAWQPETFQPPTADHHKKVPSATFSAFNTAISTIRWRHSPSDAAKLQSNARILRWSDGSLTLQFASEPNVQYELNANSLAQQQRNPIKPTARMAALAEQKKAGRPTPGSKYDEKQDSFTYLVLADQSTSTVRVTNKITAGLQIQRTQGGSEEAERLLQLALATAANSTKVHGSEPLELKVIDEDPEKARKAAEKAMAERAKAEKRRENAAQREQDKANRGFDRPSRYGGGLNIGMLEDEEDGGGRSRAKSGPRKKRQRAHGSEYSSDEDFGRQRFGNKEDEYDAEDDFLAPSDEEEEVDDDDDDDDGIVEESSGRERSPKRNRPTASSNDDDDADGEPDEGVQQVRTKRRRIVDEDDDDE
ncbi:Hypothetical protein R9X50_00219300 [Acrodontium crateriforme]|uniref:Leo1-like protein n=1 Tax=Acrodontium crateriforme TaxID=150365 RepID=A0AAQ3M0P5_9PEZI|nr:Hypothetical protein R9X50_00219300 [Acrodontium crateriforme]